MSGWIVDHLLSKVAGESLIVVALILATALGSAAVVYWRTRQAKSLRDFLSFMAPREILTHPSARADFAFWIVRRAIMPFILFPAGVAFVFAVGYATNRLVGAFVHVEAPTPAGPIVLILFTASMLIAYDLSYYLYHVAQHRVPVLWELHKVHHSAEVMVGITKDRVHPVDEFLNRIWDGVIPGVCYGLWSVFVLDPVEVTIFGLNVYALRNILMMDFVRHTHLDISFGPLNALILPPSWHQLHHSMNEKHHDRNFGLMFSFWDRMFGTLTIPEPGETFVYGCPQSTEYQSLWGLYVLPLRQMWAVAQRRGETTTADVALTTER